MMYAPYVSNSTQNQSLLGNQSFSEGKLRDVGRPEMSTPIKRSVYRSSLNDDYVGHIYSFASTIPKDYLYWFSPSPRKTLTVTGESKAQVLRKFRDAVLNTNLAIAGTLAVELHCSGYFQQAFNIVVEIIGSHVHIHNPNICSHIAERHKKFRNQLGLPSRCGITKFPDKAEDIDEFFRRPEVQAYRSTINCQTVRNFIIEVVTLVALSHQKEMALPRVVTSDVTIDKLCDSAKSYKVGGKDPRKIAKKNELSLVLQLIEKLLLFKNPKVEDAIYWVLWIVKLESRCKRKGERLPCKVMKVEGVARSEANHWVWYLWKSLITRANFYPIFKKLQIVNIYYLFRIDFTKNIAICRLPLLFFAMRLLKYDVGNNFPAVINHLHLHVQACSNVNALYRNLQIKLARRSWVDILGEETEEKVEKKTTQKIEKVEKVSKKQMKERKKKEYLDTLHMKTAYLDIVPRSNTYVG